MPRRKYPRHIKQPKNRKSPRKHRIKPHTRLGRPVKGSTRGRGK